MLAFVDPNSQQDRSGQDPNNPMAQMQADKSSHLEPLLSSWGIEFKPDLVVGDLERGLVVAMREGDPPSQHIAILGLDASSVSRDVITAHLDSINLATAGSLKLLPGSKLSFEPLLHTSKQAGLIPAMRLNMDADPATLRDGFKPMGELVVAARVSGTANSAFPNGPPAGASAAPDALKVSSKPINVVVIADSDMLSDFMWGQARNFFGQSVFQPFANNGELVWNALDNLAGSNDLISIRGRASYSRPFERVEALRRNAESQFHAKEEQLENELNQTEETLSKLQSAQPKGNEALLTSDQANEIERFQGEKLRIRKELRAVKSGLENNIKALGMWMKFINIVLVPLAFTGVALVVAAWHRRRRHALAMLHKGTSA